MWIGDKLYADIKKVMPIPTVDIVVIREDAKVLLLKRSNEPLKGRWWISGGRINRGETLLNAAKRKLKEETGIRSSQFEVVHGALSTDYGVVHTIAVATYRVKVFGDIKVTLNNEHSEYCWASERQALKMLSYDAKIQYKAALQYYYGEV